MKALITSGGKGTRLFPLTRNKNKHLLRIANKSILRYAIETVIQAGITSIGMVINAGDLQIEEDIRSAHFEKIEFTYIEQEAPLGLGHVVKISKDFIGDESFLFYLGDNIILDDITNLIKQFQQGTSNCHLVLSQVNNPQNFGVPTIQNGQIVHIEEKPNKPASNYAITGVYLYDNTIFEAVNAISQSCRGELEISDAHQYLLEQGYDITYSYTSDWKDTGEPQDLLEANKLVLSQQSNKILGKLQDSEVLNTLVLGNNSIIINSKIEGPVIIGENCVIEDSYIGPFTMIDNHCIIQKSKVYSSIINKASRVSLVNMTNTILDDESKIANRQFHNTIVYDTNKYVDVC